jgi:hypothetical protein
VRKSVGAVRTLRASLATLLVLGAVAAPTSRPTTAQSTLGLPFVGATVAYTESTEAVIAQRAGTSGARVGAATVGVSWEKLEKNPAANGDVAAWDADNLAVLDRRIDAMVANGVTPVMLLGPDVPAWAGPSTRSPPNDDQTFVRYMRALVGRYKDRVRHYFLWLESDYGQDCPACTDPPRRAYGPNGAALARLFNATTPAVKAVDPTAKVMLGPIAHDAFTNSDALVVNGAPRNAGGPFHYSFLESFMRAVNPGAIDALGLNAYPDGGVAQSWEEADPGQNVEIAAKYAHVRARLAAYNPSLADLPIVYGEGGFWRAGPSAFLGDESGNGALLYPCGDPQDRCWPANEENQARYIPKYLARAKHVGAEAAFHYTFDEVEYDGTRGVVRADGGLTTGFHALHYASLVFNSAARDPSAPALLQTTGGLTESYGVLTGGNSVVVAWARGTINPTATVSAPAGSTARDKLGAVVQGTAVAGGRVAFSLTSSPLYIGVGTSQLPEPQPISTEPLGPPQRGPGPFATWLPMILDNARATLR